MSRRISYRLGEVTNPGKIGSNRLDGGDRKNEYTAVRAVKFSTTFIEFIRPPRALNHQTDY